MRYLEGDAGDEENVNLDTPEGEVNTTTGEDQQDEAAGGVAG